jgi:oxygen-dependent protoporphyrinogen oxidase
MGSYSPARCTGTASQSSNRPPWRPKAESHWKAPSGEPHNRGTLECDVRIAVVGGGVAGLAVAARLRERAGQGAEIVIIERSGLLGGKLRTQSFHGRPIETGAEMFLVRDGGGESAVVALARRVGLGGDLLHPARVPAAIVVGGTPYPIPEGTLLGVPSDPSTLDGLAQVWDRDHDAGRPLLAPGEDVAVGDLVRRRWGDEVVDRLVDPMLGGVYAGRADRLSLAATMPGLHEAAQHHTTVAAAVKAALAASPRPAGSPVFATIRGGLTRLVDAVTVASGAEVRLGLPVRELTRTPGGWRLAVGSVHDPYVLTADAVVLAVPAVSAARLWPESDIGLDYASVALVTLALPAQACLPSLSGILVPAAEGYAVKAATFLTVKWPQLRGGPVVVRASLGRHGDTSVLRRTDADLTALVRVELCELLGTSLPEPLHAEVFRWGGSLPQYGVGHVQRVRAVRAALPETLALAGAAFDGVGIAACVRSGEAAADRVLGQ